MRWSYRTAAAPQETAMARRSPMGNRDIAPLFAALWLASVVRVAFALFNHETFGTELTLVFVTVVLVPVLLFSSRLARRP